MMNHLLALRNEFDSGQNGVGIYFWVNQEASIIIKTTIAAFGFIWLWHRNFIFSYITSDTRILAGTFTRTFTGTFTGTFAGLRSATSRSCRCYRSDNGDSRSHDQNKAQG